MNSSRLPSDFKMEWTPMYVSTSPSSKPQLWIVWDKFTSKTNEVFYDVEYWESPSGVDNREMLLSSEALSSYPEKIQEWERKFGQQWAERYKDGGNPYDPTPKRAIVDSPNKKPKVVKRTRFAEDVLSRPPPRSEQFRRAPNFVLPKPNLPPIRKTSFINRNYKKPSFIPALPLRSSENLKTYKRESESAEDSHVSTSDDVYAARPILVDQKATPAAEYMPAPIKTNAPVPVLTAPIKTNAPVLVSTAPIKTNAPTSEVGNANVSRMSPPPAPLPSAEGLHTVENLTQAPLVDVDALPGSVEENDAVDDLPPSSQDEIHRLEMDSANQLAERREQVQSPSQRNHEEQLERVLRETLEESREDNGGILEINVELAESTVDKYARTLQDAHGQGIRQLVQAALSLEGLPCDKWVQRRRNNKDSFLTVQVELITILASIHPLILKHLVYGDIPQAEKTDPQIRAVLSQLRKRRPEDLFPSIYIQYLVDFNGVSPTARELLQIIDEVEVYARGYKKPHDQASHDFAVRVDGQSGKGAIFRKASIEKGIRCYISKDSQADIIAAWITTMRARLNSSPIDEPLKRPLCEVGFAKRLNTRLQQHEKHSSSNYIMNLVESICKVNHRNFHIAQYGVFHIFEQIHAMLGEIITSRIAQAYITHGGGFSHYQAGVSHAGANDILENDYRELKLKVYEDRGFVTRMNAELDQMSAQKRKISTLYDKLDDGVQDMSRSAKDLPMQLEKLKEISSKRQQPTLDIDACKKLLELFRKSKSHDGPPDAS